MKKTYKVIYKDQEAIFDVDTEIFTEDIAKSFLEFFTDSINSEGSYIGNAIKEIARRCFYLTMDGYNTFGVKNVIKETEGYFKIDGTYGVNLISIDAFEIDEYELELINIK